MDPICPLLTLGSDRRAVCDAVDIDHRCGVVGGPDPVPRGQQVEFCLSPTYAECPHFVRHALASPAVIEGIPPPSPDVVMAPTRLVVERASASSSRSVPRRSRSVVAVLVLVVAATGAIGFGAVDRVANLLGSAVDPARDVAGILPGATKTATPSDAPTPNPTPTSTAIPTPGPVSSPAPTATPVASTAPTSKVLASQTYIVQPGDTLRAIADRYGTSVAALTAANGIVDQNLIAAGQALVIP